MKAATNGSFSTGWQLRNGINRFVAQWTGDCKSRGAGSKVMTVRVTPAKKR